MDKALVGRFSSIQGIATVRSARQDEWTMTIQWIRQTWRNRAKYAAIQNRRRFKTTSERNTKQREAEWEQWNTDTDNRDQTTVKGRDGTRNSGHDTTVRHRLDSLMNSLVELHNKCNKYFLLTEYLKDDLHSLRQYA